MKQTLVIKIGGSYWGHAGSQADERCRGFARGVARLSELYNLVVVPSAFAGRTDQLKAAAETIYGQPLKQCHEVDAIIGRGEIEVSQQLYENLTALGIKARVVNPHLPEFPIHADNNGVVDLLDSYKKLGELSENCKKNDEILIVPGFVAKNCGGIVTLGRNGSDYSAVIVGEGVRADEIVKLGAAPGIPDNNGGRLKEILVNDLLKKVGSNKEGYEKVDCIFHPEGLKILSQGRVINVTNTIEGYLSGNIECGTIIRA